jgi:hypothetical protein
MAPTNVLITLVDPQLISIMMRVEGTCKMSRHVLHMQRCDMSTGQEARFQSFHNCIPPTDKYALLCHVHVVAEMVQIRDRSDSR